jgi:hypothetical protein
MHEKKCGQKPPTSSSDKCFDTLAQSMHVCEGWSGAVTHGTLQLNQTLSCRKKS